MLYYYTCLAASTSCKSSRDGKGEEFSREEEYYLVVSNYYRIHGKDLGSKYGSLDVVQFCVVVD